MENFWNSDEFPCLGHLFWLHKEFSEFSFNGPLSARDPRYLAHLLPEPSLVANATVLLLQFPLDTKKWSLSFTTSDKFPKIYPRTGKFPFLFIKAIRNYTWLPEPGVRSFETVVVLEILNFKCCSLLNYCLTEYTPFCLRFLLDPGAESPIKVFLSKAHPRLSSLVSMGGVLSGLSAAALHYVDIEVFLSEAHQRLLEDPELGSHVLSGLSAPMLHYVDIEVFLSEAHLWLLEDPEPGSHWDPYLHQPLLVQIRQLNHPDLLRLKVWYVSL